MILGAFCRVSGFLKTQISSGFQVFPVDILLAAGLNKASHPWRVHIIVSPPPPESSGYLESGSKWAGKGDPFRT